MPILTIEMPKKNSLPAFEKALLQMKSCVIKAITVNAYVTQNVDERFTGITNAMTLNKMNNVANIP